MSELSGTEGPLPLRTMDSNPFWDSCRKGVLELQQCDGCQAFRYPPMPGCPTCGRRDHRWVPVAASGTVERSTIVRARMHPAFEPPFALVVVRLDCGALMTSRIVGPCEAVEHGARVRVVWRDLAEADTALPLFELAP